LLFSGNLSGMDFDFEQVPAPFRMQPGLQRIPAEQARLTPLRSGSPLHTEKRAVVEAGQALHRQVGFDPRPALSTLARLHAGESAPDGQTGEDSLPLALRWEEDLAILDSATGTLPWLCVCVPSHWAPEDKLGLGFAAMHAPVADNAALLASATHLVRLVTDGNCWRRHVWTVTPDPHYDQHPRRAARAPWPDDVDPETFARRCFLRVERQTFIPVPAGDKAGTRQAVFAIRVMIEPLSQAVFKPAQARRLHDSLASMSEAVLDYKNLRPARDRLLSWLDIRTRTT
jgi:dimethylamine monooxygenase subunit A